MGAVVDQDTARRRGPDTARSRGAVGVWSLDLSLPDEAVEPAWALLDADERARAGRFRLAAERTAFISRRAAYRLLLGALVGSAPEALRYVHDPYGKPRLDRPGAPCFSTSRSAGRALLAVAASDVGVDLEAEDPRIDCAALAPRILSPAELGAWARLEPSLRLRSFYKAWVRKEAIAKALGAGLRLDVRTLDVWRPHGATPQYVAEDGAIWRTTDLDSSTGFVASVTVRGSLPCVTQADWRWSA